MITEIAAGLGSLKTATELIKGLNAAKTEATLNEVKIELQGLILEAQQGLFAAQEAQTSASKRITELEQQLIRLNDWKEEKQRYELADTGQGAFAYRLKPGIDMNAPHHWLCPVCFEDGRKSVLQYEQLYVGRAERLVCHRCGLDILTQGSRHKEHPRAGAWGRES